MKEKYKNVKTIALYICIYIIINNNLRLLFKTLCLINLMLYFLYFSCLRI